MSRGTINTSRLLIEIILAVALAEFTVMFILPVVAPGVGDTVEAALDASMLSLLAGPIILWRVRAAQAWANRLETDGPGSSDWSLKLLVVAVALGGGILSTLMATSLSHSIWSEARGRFKQLVDKHTERLEDGINRSIYGLRGIGAMLMSNPHQTRESFRKAVSSWDLPREFPGAIGLGFIERVPRGQLDAFVATTRSDNAPEFAVSTAKETDQAAADLYVIKMIEPLEHNRRALGFDVGSEPVRRAAIEKAIRTGQPTITGRINLVQDDHKRPGFLYFLPLYQPGLPTQTPAQRDAALMGVVYAPIILESALEAIGMQPSDYLNAEIYDGSTPSIQTMMYDSDGFAEAVQGAREIRQDRTHEFSSSREIRISDRTWSVVFSSSERFSGTINHWLAPVAGVSGCLVSLVLSASIWSLGTSRAKAMALVAERTSELAKSRDEAHAALSKVQAFRRTLDQRALISIADRSGRIIDINDRFCEVSGYSRDELLGQDHRIINSGYHPKEFWVNMWRTIASGQLWTGEICNRSKNGEHYWVDSIIAPYSMSGGTPDCYVSIRNEITAQKRGETELRRASEELQVAATNLRAMAASLEEAQAVARMGSWSYSLVDRKLQWSRQLFVLFGREGQKDAPSYGESLQDYKSESAEALEQAIWRAIDCGEAFSLVLETRRPEPAAKHIRIEGRARRDEAGNVLSLYGTATDVTAEVEHTEALRSARLQAEAASRAKSEFLANMSHEIRTPMTAILGYAGLLAESELQSINPAEFMEYIRTIQRNGDHLLSIINDILDLSKIEAGRMTVEAVPVDMRQLLLEVESLMSVKSAAKGISLTVEFTTPIPSMIRSDPVRLRQILVNLVGNAIKFTELGSVRVRSGVFHDESGQRMRIEVTDTGLGMTPDQVARLFEAFTQADASTTRRFGGTGLGLRISKSLANMLGGDINAISEMGKGSTFIVTLPLTVVDDTTVLAPDELREVRRLAPSGSPSSQSRVEAPAATSGPPLAGLRVFLAEDGPDNQRLIAFHLKRAGAEVQVFGNGKLALEALTVDGHAGSALADPPPCDLVVTDIQMPEMDGYELARTLRNRGWSRGIIALTAHAMDGDAARCLAAGCDHYASKPVDRDKLIEVCHLASAGYRKVG